MESDEKVSRLCLFLWYLTSHCDETFFELVWKFSCMLSVLVMHQFLVTQEYRTLHVYQILHRIGQGRNPNL